MGQILRSIFDWLQIADWVSKLWAWIKPVWGWSMLAAITWFLNWLDWQLVCIAALFLLGVIAGLAHRRDRIRVIQDAKARADAANERADCYKLDMGTTWLQSRSHILDHNTRRTAIVQYLVVQKREAAAAFAQVLIENGWHVTGPSLITETNPDVSLNHSAKLEVNGASAPGSEGWRYGDTLQRLTGEHIYVVDADPVLQSPVGMRVTMYT